MNKKTTHIIGDVHGCIHELKELVEKLNLQQGEHRLIFLGDLIDKGVDSPATIKYVRSLSSDYDVQLVLGNHEEKLLRYLHQRSLRKTTVKLSDETLETASALSTSDIEFLQTAKLYIPLPDYNAIVVHGGFRETLIELPTHSTYNPSISKRMREKYSHLYWLRYIDTTTSHPVRLADVTEKHRHWSETYDGRFGHVYYGHQSYQSEDKPVESQHATGLDLGAVYGGYLAAITLTETERKIHTVKAKHVYYENFNKNMGGGKRPL